MVLQGLLGTRTARSYCRGVGAEGEGLLPYLEPCHHASCSLGDLRVVGLPGPSPLLFVCSWTVKEQCVNLLAKKLWEELLDDEQPDITIMDW